eukprot:g33146.t1
MANPPSLHIFGPEHLEENHADMERMCKLHTDSCPRMELNLGPLAREGELRTRQHRFKVRGDRFKMDMRGNFFTQRVVHKWNKLPEVVEKADS